jgi:hypothetical protein
MDDAIEFIDSVSDAQRISPRNRLSGDRPRSRQ